ncbi:TetR/AcrR family transcriptional regulator C-terminal domain-containing protein [Microbacterium sp. K24]|uniref:TetR/AcrR family transcriptional regulator C-terminal domain-containing protein n=1 Tax=Microbacterium sp. K24 TaxID=2305446 RepID=UPI00109C9BD6|nr:TetR/AcrR family transcriptional regulator C-terminal domain-containing protein [Microbacterium sp. K24]
MAKLARDTVISEALNLLDDVGLDGVSTRRLAARLGVEQPSLYWHFRNKGELLAAMAEAAMAPHATASLPTPTDEWREWFLENTHSFRRTLLMRRDGARLHAGLVPGADLDRIAKKMAFLTAAGLPERDAQFAMLAASRFTVGSVLEEQSETQDASPTGEPIGLPSMDHTLAFEEGLRLIVDGLTRRVEGSARDQ